MVAQVKLLQLQFIFKQYAKQINIKTETMAIVIQKVTLLISVHSSIV